MKIQKKKTFMVSMTLAALLLTSNLNAQERTGGLFGFQEKNDGLFDSQLDDPQGLLFRDGMPIENNGFTLGGLTSEDPTTEESPLGSGLLILAATGAGYALLKKKEEKK